MRGSQRKENSHGEAQEGFLASEARGRCAVRGAILSSPLCAWRALNSWWPASERTLQLQGNRPKHQYNLFKLFLPIVPPPPDVLSQQKPRSFQELTSRCIFSEKSKMLNSVYSAVQWGGGQIRRNSGAYTYSLVQTQGNKAPEIRRIYRGSYLVEA